MTKSILSERILRMVESETLRMAQKTRDLKASGVEIIDMSLGEPDFDTPEYIKEAAHKALVDGYTKYTPVPGLMSFRKAISEKLENENDLIFDPDQIIVSNGAKQSFANICMSILNKGDEVVLFTPYWVSYLSIIEMADGVAVKVQADIENDYKVTPDQLESAITPRTKAVLFSSPCNPTGSVYNYEELRRFADVIAKFPDIIVISDEIYEHIQFDKKHVSIGIFESIKDRTVVINGMSKGFAMTGWRIGYMAGPKWLVSNCSKIQGQFTSGACSFGQKASELALKRGPDMDMINTFKSRKFLINEGLSKIPGMKVNDPQGAFYIFPDVSHFFGKTINGVKINSANEFSEFLLEYAHVSSVSGSAFGADKCVRFSYATSDENITEACRRLKKCLVV